MKFPIIEVEGNTILSLSGKKSCFYRLKVPDIEQEKDLSQFISILTADLSRFPTDKFFKFYLLRDEIFLSTDFLLEDGSSFLSSVSFFKEENPLSFFVPESSYKEIDFFDGFYQSENRFFQILSVRELPSSINLRALSFLGDYVINLKRKEAASAKGELDFKRRIHFSSILQSLRNIDSEQSFKESEDLLERISTGEDSLFEVEIFFIVSSEEKNELYKKTKDILRRSFDMDLLLKLESRALPYFFSNILPGVVPSFKRSQPVPASFLSYLLPLHEDFVMEKGMSFSTLYGKEVFFDLFHEASHNYNILITGSSGQGKSMLANKIIHDEVGRETKAIILDLGGSFRKGILFHGGVELSHKINPMQFKDPTFLKEFIKASMGEGEVLTSLEDGMLFSKIKEALEGEDLSFRNLLQILENDFKGISFYFEELWPYLTEEVYELTDLTYTDFTGLPERMKGPLIIYLIECFKALEGKKIFVFDECWHLLLKHADYIAECFRTFRKHYASAVAIGQNLDDFMSSPLGKVIVQNTYYKAFFKQNGIESEAISDEQKRKIDDLCSKKGEYSEFLLSSESIEKYLRFYADPLEYELFTSDKLDNKSFYKFVEEYQNYFSFKDSVLSFIKFKYFIKESPYEA